MTDPATSSATAELPASVLAGWFYHPTPGALVVFEVPGHYDMAAAYTLVKPIFAFWKDIGQVVIVPAGAMVRLANEKDTVALCVASWDSRLFLAFGEDIRRNGVAVDHIG